MKNQISFISTFNETAISYYQSIQTISFFEGYEVRNGILVRYNDSYDDEVDYKKASYRFKQPIHPILLSSFTFDVDADLYKFAYLRIEINNFEEVILQKIYLLLGTYKKICFIFNYESFIEQSSSFVLEFLICIEDCDYSFFQQIKMDLKNVRFLDGNIYVRLLENQEFPFFFNREILFSCYDLKKINLIYTGYNFCILKWRRNLIHFYQLCGILKRSSSMITVEEIINKQCIFIGFNYDLGQEKRKLFLYLKMCATPFEQKLFALFNRHMLFVPYYYQSMKFRKQISDNIIVN